MRNFRKLKKNASLLVIHTDLKITFGCILKKFSRSMFAIFFKSSWSIIIILLFISIKKDSLLYLKFVDNFFRDYVNK